MVARFRMAYHCDPGQFTIAVFFDMLEEATAARRWLDGKVSDDEAGGDAREESDYIRQIFIALPNVLELPPEQ